MRFLSIAERELRAGARRKGTYRVRWIIAASFFGLLAWLMWAFDSFRAPEVFRIYSTLTFYLCVIIGTAYTADCLSSEKREGTMGLLFLTNLNGLEIIGGKLCSSALAAMYGLIAIFPLLSLQMLIGGITLGHFWRTLLALLNAIFFSVATGFLTSSFCLRQFTAVATATGLALFISVGLMGLAFAANAFRTIKTLANDLALFSPFYSLASAQSGSPFGLKHYWWSILAVAGLSCVFLAVATLRVSWSWQDRASGPRAWTDLRLLDRWRERGKAGRAALRHRLLAINPFFWLGGRRAVSAPIFIAVTVILLFLISCIAAPFFGRVMRTGVASPMAGHLFAWAWALILVHALVLYYAAMTASQRLAEDKQTGALELVLSTPTSERSISRGLWMAYLRKMFFPASIAILVHFFLIWQAATMAILDPPSAELPPGTTAGQLIWHVLLGRPIGTYRIEWGLTVAMRIALLSLLLLAGVWVTLGWVSRWLGLCMKRPGFAPMVALALVFVPCIVLFSCVSYCAAQLHLDRLPPRILIPNMVWVVAGIGAGHCLLLSLWAAGRLRRGFRTVVTTRFQPRVGRWWRPTRQRMIRIALRAASAVVAFVIIVLCFYVYQNWRSRRAWSAFQNELKQRRESLDVAAYLPAPVADSENFALTPAFRNWVSPVSSTGATERLVRQLKQFDIADTPWGNLTPGIDWTRQSFAPLDDYLIWITPDVTLRKDADAEQLANLVLKGLSQYEETMRALSAATRLLYFQTSTNRGSLQVLLPAKNENAHLVRLHMLFQVRGCALLGAKRASEAHDDLMTSLRLVRLARQIPDAESLARTEVLLVRSLQPLWEGIVEHLWTDPQLVNFQTELASFDLLTDYTNTVRRVVLAHIETWHAIGNTPSPRLPPQLAQTYDPDSVWKMQPRAWWFDNCVQLYEAGEDAIKRVEDVVAGRIHLDASWPDLQGLPLDEHSTYLLQQGYWIGAMLTFAQTSVNQAIIACALERFRLAEAKYPETLSELVPKFLREIPRDVVRGLPMLYENNSDGQFILRSVGPNQTDDRAKPSSDDWLWSFPTNAPAKIVR